MSKSSPLPTDTETKLIESLCELKVALRQDVIVSRHRFQGEASYLIHDPVTFQNHRLSLDDYRVVSFLQSDRTLAECFQRLKQTPQFANTTETEFFQFVAQLQRAGILSVPLTNGKQLFAQFERFTKLSQKKGLMGYLFLQIPLSNPDAFLDKTVGYVRWLFSRSFLLLWIVAAFGAIAIVTMKWGDFWKPWNSLLAANNLAFMWLAFIGLKVWHELGHGYACKAHGGRVPEMGTMLMFGTPLAYVDASAAWSFPRRRDRLLVMLGGMYFESLIAIPAVFVWAFANNPSVQSFAYQLVFMAGFTTLLFNANPLMRYDGYFVACELLGIPNLRKRSENELRCLAKRIALGLPTTLTSSLGMRTTLIAYGIAAALYRTMLVLGISAMLATKFFVAGLAIGGWYIAKTVWGVTGKLCLYLLFADETAQVRPRARLLAGFISLGVPIILLFFPVLGGIRTMGTVTAEKEHVLRARVPGFVQQVSVSAGAPIGAGSEIVRLTSLDVEAKYAVAKATLQATLLEHRSVVATDPIQAMRQAHEVEQRKHEFLQHQKRFDELTIRPSIRGTVATNFQPHRLGSYVGAGDPVATVVAGRGIVRVWLSEDELQACHPQPGDRVQCRFNAAVDHCLQGIVQSVRPATTRDVKSPALTIEAGGQIPIDPISGESVIPYVGVEILLPDADIDDLVYQSTSHVRFDRIYEPIGFWIARHCLKFIQKLSIS